MVLNEMTKRQLLKKLQTLRRKESKAIRERKEYTRYLLDNGVDVYGRIARAERNKLIYDLFKKGWANRAIANKVELTDERVRSIIKRMELYKKREAEKK